MNKRTNPIAIAFVLASLVPAILLPSQIMAQGMPAGAKVVLVAEYSVDIPGVEKVIVQRLTMEPGVVWKDITVKGVPFCDATKGILSVTEKATGKTTVFSPGSRWAPPEGLVATLTNVGDTVHEHWITRVIRKK